VSKPKPSREVGERIEAARLDRGLTRARLAENVGVRVTQVADWEAGRSTPSTDRLVLVAKALSVPPSWLRFGDRIRPPRLSSE
jgi:transcriptional regulator with XRE-family HTH domain